MTRLSSSLESFLDEEAFGFDSSARTSLFTLTPGLVSKGVLSSFSDRDYYAINLTVGDYTIEMTSDAGNYGFSTFRDDSLLEFDITDLSGNILRSSSPAGTFDDLDLFTVTSGGTFYVDVHTNGFSSADYAILLISEGNSSSQPDVAGDISTTASLTMNSSVFSEHVNVGSSVDLEDFFSVSLVAGLTYQFDLEGSDTNAGTLLLPFLRLYDSNGVLITSDFAGGTDNNSRLIFTPTTTDTYFAASVGGESPDFQGTYKLSVEELTNVAPDIAGDRSTIGVISVQNAVPGFTFPNESVSSEHTEFDFQDWFAVSLVAGETYIFNLYGTSTTRPAFTLSDPYLELFNNAGQFITGDNNSGEDNDAQITYTATTTGTHYLASTSAAINNLATGTYGLEAYRNRLPVAQDDNASVRAGESVVINIGANDSDLDGHAISTSGSTNPQKGTVIYSDNVSIDTVTYTPRASASGTDTFSYQITDEKGGVDIATVTVSIEADTTIADRTLTTSKGQKTEIDLSSEPGLSVLSIVSPPSNGILSEYDKSSLLFDAAFYLSNNADVVVSISQGFFASGLEHFNATGGRELRNPNSQFDMSYYLINNPDALNAVAAGIFRDGFHHYQTAGYLEGRAISGELTGIHSLDPDNDSLVYVPNTNFTGTDTFSYSINGSSITTVDVSVIDTETVNNVSEDISHSFSQAQVLGIGSTINSVIEAEAGGISISGDGNDLDGFSVNLEEGTTYRVDVTGTNFHASINLGTIDGSRLVNIDTGIGATAENKGGTAGTVFQAFASGEYGISVQVKQNIIPTSNGFLQQQAAENGGTYTITIEETSDLTNAYVQDGVYRFFNTDTGVHFYSGSWNERNVIVDTLPNFNLEGPSFKAANPENGATSSVFRFFNTGTGTHFFTQSDAEKNNILENIPSFNFEGEAYLGYTGQATGSTPLYRFLNTDTGTHFFTPDKGEAQSVVDNLSMFNYEGIAYYVDTVGGVQFFGEPTIPDRSPPLEEIVAIEAPDPIERTPIFPPSFDDVGGL